MFLEKVNSNKILLIILIIILSIIFISTIISGIKYSNKKILTCEKCGKKQSVFFMLKINDEERKIKSKCIHCGYNGYFKVVDNLKDVTIPDGWKFHKIIIDGDNLFQKQWIDTGKKIIVYDPSYNEKHIFPIYEIKEKNKTKEYAIGEFSNSIYGVYVKIKNK